MGCHKFCENNTGCQWQPIIFPLISKSYGPYSYQGYLRINNIKVLSWALNFQNPKPKTDLCSSTKIVLIIYKPLTYILNVPKHCVLGNLNFNTKVVVVYLFLSLKYLYCKSFYEFNSKRSDVPTIEHQ